MALWNRKVQANFASSPRQIRAGAGAAIGALNTYSSGVLYERLMRIPSVVRAHDLLVSMVSGLPINEYTLQWDGGEYVEMELPGETWMSRPDPRTTRQFILSRTASDLIVYGRAFWYVTARNASDNRPAAFRWLPANNVETPMESGGPFWYGPADEIEFNGYKIPTNDVVQFISPVNGLIATSQRMVTTAERLDEAAARFARNEIAAGYIQIGDNTEPMDAEELTDLTAAWSQARRESAIGVLQGAKWVEFQSTPDKLQLTEGRQHQALEAARLCSVPAYLISAPTGGSMTYQNAEQANRDLYQFGAKPLIDCISETLSMDNILPRGRYCRLDVSSFVTELEKMETMQENQPGVTPGATVEVQ